MEALFHPHEIYVKNINGKPHLFRKRPDRDRKKSHSKSPSKHSQNSNNSSSGTRRSASQPASRSSTTPKRASVEDDNEEEVNPYKDPYSFIINIPYEKITDFFSGSSTTKTERQEKAKAKQQQQQQQQAMVDEKKEGSSESSKPTTTKTSNVSGLLHGLPAQPGIYQMNGRTMALVPNKGPHMGLPMGNTGYVGGAYPPGAYGQYPMGGMMMQQPMGMSMGMGMNNGVFGGFNSQYDRPVEVTNVQPATAEATWTAKHVCDGCGRLRSKKFQQENPLELGEIPPISYCRKCEKEIMSTDDEDSDRGGQKFKTKKEKTSRRPSLASYTKRPEPQVVVQPVIIKEKHHKKSRKEKEKESEKVDSKPAVSKEAAAHLHICAQCGNPRSKKYQARHPIRKGETPPPAFCGKCQKDETSSEGESGNDEESESVTSRERTSSMSSRQYVSMPMVDGGMERIVTTTRRRQKVRVPPPIKVVEEEYFSSSDSADLMPPPPRPHKMHHKLRSSDNKKTYESQGDGLQVARVHRDHREGSEERGRDRGRAGSQSHHYRHERRSIYEVPSPLVQETIVTETVPVRSRQSRARSLDRGERPTMGSRARSASRHTSKPAPPRKYRYNDRGDRVSYASESESDTEEIAKEMYKAYLSDGAPMHEESRHYQHHENIQHAGGGEMSNSASFNSVNSNRFSESSQRRRRERSQSGHVPAGYSQPVHQESQRPDPVLQRPPDEVIVTTERYVFKKPELPSSSRVSSSHTVLPRDDRHERESNASSRRNHKKITHDDRAEYYPTSWTHRDSQDRKVLVSPASRPAMLTQEEVRREHRSRDYTHDDFSSIDPVPGSFLDTDSIRSQDPDYDDRIANPIGLLRNKANTNTASISTDYTSETYTTSSGSYSSRNTGSGSSRRKSNAARGGDATPRAYPSPTLPHVPGGYVSEEEEVTPKYERDRGRSHNRSPERRNNSPRRRLERSRSNYHQPSVSDVGSSDDDMDSDHATAGVNSSRSKSRNRGNLNARALTANDRIRSRSVKRGRRVSFGEMDRVHTYSQVSLPSTSGGVLGGGGAVSTEEVLREIEKARELERRREESRLGEEERSRRELERRKMRHREREVEREEERRRRERQRDCDQAYKSGRN